VGAGHAHALYVHEHSPVHHLPAHVKVVATVGFVLSVATTPRGGGPAYAGLALLLLAAIRVARVPLRFVALRALVVLPFLITAALLPFVASGPRTSVLGLSLSVDGIAGGGAIAAKALLGAAASILLVATTEVPVLLRGLERLRLPSLLTQIATFMVRYLEVIAGEFSRQRTAMTARGYDPRWLWQAKPVAISAGALFVRAYERGERVHSAMLARGYTGTLPRPLDDAPATARDWATAALLPAGAVLVRVLEALT
jgi:cobalt/nickel transport system permease protein